VSVAAVDAVSHGYDTIQCRDVRYKGEDTSACRFIERSSGICDQAATTDPTISSTVTVNSEISSETTEDKHSQQPITEQQPELPVPITMQHFQLDLQQQPEPQPIAVQQVGQPELVTYRPITKQQPAMSQPITMQQEDLTGPITMQEPLVSEPLIVDTSQPVTEPQPSVSQPITVWQADLPRPIVKQQLPVSQSVTGPQPLLSQPVTFQQPDAYRPITRQQSSTSQSVMPEQLASVFQVDSAQPIASQQPTVSQPTTSQQPISVYQPALLQPPDSARPVALQQPTVLQPITSQQPVSVSQPALLQPPDSARPIASQQPTVSQPITMQQVEQMNLASQTGDVNSLPSTFVSASQQQATPTAFLNPPTGGHMYPPSIPPPTVGLVPPGSTPPFSHAASPQTRTPFQTNSAQAQIPPPTFMQDVWFRPPLPINSLPEIMGTPVAPPMCSPMSQPQIAPHSSSMQFLPERTAGVLPPGILCRPQSPELNHRYVSSPESAVEYRRLMSLEKFNMQQRFTDAVRDGRPPPFMIPYGSRFQPGYPNTGHMPVSMPPDLRASSSDSMVYGQRDYAGQSEDFANSAAQNENGDGKLYSEGVYVPNSSIPYFSGLENPLYTSSSVWPVQEFQPMREFSVASPGGGYFCMPQIPSPPQMMYRVATPGVPQWNIRDTVMDYTGGYSMPNLMASAYPLEVNAVEQGADFSASDQSSVGATSSVADVEMQLGSDGIRSSAKFQPSDPMDVIKQTTESCDGMPESGDMAEEYDTIAGRFSQGDYVDCVLT